MPSEARRPPWPYPAWSDRHCRPLAWVEPLRNAPFDASQFPRNAPRDASHWAPPSSSRSVWEEEQQQERKQDKAGKEKEKEEEADELFNRTQ